MIKRGADGDGGGGAEVIGIERDADAVVDGQDELFVSLSPVLDDGDVGGRARGHHQHPVLRLGRHVFGAEDGNVIFRECEWDSEGKGI